MVVGGVEKMEEVLVENVWKGDGGVGLKEDRGGEEEEEGVKGVVVEKMRR